MPPELVFVAFGIGVAAAMPLALAGSTRLRKGLWKAHRSGTGLVWFDSDLGRLAFDHRGHVRFLPPRGEERAWPLADVRGLRFAYDRRVAPEALGEFDYDHFSRRSGMHNVLDRYEIALVTSQGDVPVFIAGQMFPRLTGLTWISDAVTDLSARWGLVPDVESYASDVARELQDEFARRGYPLRLL